VNDFNGLPPPPPPPPPLDVVAGGVGVGPVVKAVVPMIMAEDPVRGLMLPSSGSFAIEFGNVNVQ